MTLDSLFATKVKRHSRVIVAGTLVVTAALVLGPALAHAAGGGPYKPSDAVSFEEIPGSPIKRVILKERAAERLGIELGEVSEETIVLKQMVGGLIIPPVEEPAKSKVAEGMFGGFGQVTEVTASETAMAATGEPASDEYWVRLTLSEGEWERMRKDKPARILPLPTRDALESDVLAMPSTHEPVLDLKRTMLKMYYIIPGTDHGLNLYERVRVELELEGTGKKRMVVPYSAVYYDGVGKAWVYVSVDHLVYERQPIEVERIVGDLAVITEGPPLGTAIVTTGAALLYGAEVIYKR